MQTAHRTSHIKRIHEISFSSLENYNSKNESRNQSPSIALESILKETPSDEETEECLYTIRKRYIQNDECTYQPNKRQKYDERKENIGSICLNILKSKAGHCSMQTKQQNLIQRISKISKTPLKDMTNTIQSQDNNTSAYYSNMSPVEDEKTETPSQKTKDKRSISSLNCVNQDHSYEVISSTSYEMLSEKYLHSTNKNQSQYSDCRIEGEICKLRKQIEQLQSIKKNRTVQIDHQITSQSCATDRKPKNQKFTDRMNVKSNYTQRQGETLSLSASNSTDCLIKSRIITFRQGINQEDVKRPKLLNKMFSKTNKCAKEKTPAKQNSENSQVMTTKKRPLTIMKPQKVTLPSPRYTSDLLQCIQQQIKLDENLRKAKKWFKKYTYPRKWQDLRGSLLGQDINFSQKEQNTIFNLTSQQQSPFYTPKQSDYTIGQLVLNYIAAQNHWSSFIHKRHPAKLLQQGSFKEQNLDISKRGEICIEDLVRYLNFELDTCYRNRDIYLIFNRFSKGEKIYFTGILQCLSNESL